MRHALAVVDRDSRQDEAFSFAVSNQDWNFADADTGYLTHAIHRYSGKFIPQIAAHAISLISQPGDVVLDPYCGSGTTVLEAALQTRRAIGVDLNPLAVLIARAKVTAISEIESQWLMSHFLAASAAAATQGSLFSYDVSSADGRTPEDHRLSNPWFQKWFGRDVLIELVHISREIGRLDNPRLRDVATVAFSNILRRVSNAHQGYPNVMFDRNARKRPRPYPLFLKSLREVTHAVVNLSTQDIKWSNCLVEEGDARSLRFDDESVDAVVTHPPYIGSIPYAEYGALSLMWLGRDPKQLDRGLTGGRRQSRDVVERFIEDYQAMLRQCARVLKQQRLMFILVGNPVVLGKLIGLSEITVELAEKAGFSLVSSAIRSGSNRRANKMGSEHLLFFRLL